jgi:hypothetical protein
MSINHIFILLFSVSSSSRKCFQLYLTANCHHMGTFLNSHMAMVLPSAYTDMPFLANLGPIWGLCAHLYTSWGKAKSIPIHFPGNNLHNYFKYEDHFLFSFLSSSCLHTHLPSSTRSRDNLIAGKLESCQDRLSGLRHHNHLKGLTACALWMWNLITRR